MGDRWHPLSWKVICRKMYWPVRTWWLIVDVDVNVWLESCETEQFKNYLLLSLTPLLYIMHITISRCIIQPRNHSNSKNHKRKTSASHSKIHMRPIQSTNAIISHKNSTVKTSSCSGNRTQTRTVFKAVKRNLEKLRIELRIFSILMRCQ